MRETETHMSRLQSPEKQLQHEATQKDKVRVMTQPMRKTTNESFIQENSRG